MYALPHLEKGQTAINVMRNRQRPALLNRARALHETAGVPAGPCTLRKVEQLKQHLNIQIVVISSDNLNRLCNFYCIFYTFIIFTNLFYLFKNTFYMYHNNN